MLGIKIFISEAENGFLIKFFSKDLKKHLVAKDFSEAMFTIKEEAWNIFHGGKV